MNLYQYAFGYQPHYIVAINYADAEEGIKAAGYSMPDRIDCLGPYVLVTEESQETP